MLENSTKITLQFILNAVKNFKWLIISTALMSLALAGDISLRPYLIKKILNNLTNYKFVDFHTLWLWVGFYLGLIYFISVFFRIYTWLRINLRPKLRAHAANSATAFLIKQSQNFYQNQFIGSLANKVNNCMDGLADIIITILDKFFIFTLAIFIAAFTMWNVNYHFAIALIIWSVGFIGMAIYLSPRVRNLAVNSAETRSKLTGHLVDILSNILSIRLFVACAKEKEMFQKPIQNMVDAYQTQGRFFLIIYFVQDFSFAVFQTFCLYWLITGFHSGIITAGDFGLILILSISMHDLLWTFSDSINSFVDSWGNLTQGLKIIMTPLEIKDQANAKELISTKGTIKFENVYFRYQETNLIFEDLSISIPGGQKVGLVGFSGAGKTTFINLILRLFDIEAGRILIDDQDISKVTQNSLRKSITLITQDLSLFHRSILENIRYGNLEATDDEVIEAAKLANAHQFILKLSHGYQTLVGERGIKLSGGQRQRIALARAFLKKAPIIILDEPTSQLDSASEKLIQKSLTNLMQNKTVLVIAHRLSTIINMDRILVFDSGRIIEDGSHLDLLFKNGIYKKFWEMQAKNLAK